jgi:hypothetical protein
MVVLAPTRTLLPMEISSKQPMEVAEKPQLFPMVNEAF